MEGLEITVLQIKEVLELDETGRIDSGFYSKDQIRIRKLAELWETLGDSCETIACGPFGSTILDTNYVDDGVPMVRPFNLRNLRTDAGDIVHLSNEFVTKQGLKLFKRGDLMFARVGDVGCSTLVQEQATISPNIIAASLKAGTLNPFFVAVFFNTVYGKLQMQGAMKVVAQPTISTDLIRRLKVPKLARAFQSAVEQSFTKSESLLTRANNAQLQAEQTLLRVLGMEGWNPPHPLTYIRRASEAFAANRIDSNYFAPARYATIQKLAATPHRLLSECCDSIRDLFDPNEPQGIQEVRNFDLSEALKPTFDDGLPPVPISEIGSTKKFMRRGDVVISRLRSYLRQIAVVNTSDAIPTVGSTEFIVLRPKAGIDPEVLMVFLRSQPVQTVLKYCQEGNQHPRFSENNLLDIPFPDLLLQHSGQIVAQIRQARESREEAQALLVKAKRAVEIAIEESESVAITYLKGS